MFVRPRHGLSGAICAFGLFSAACAARAPMPATPALTGPAASAPAPAAPAPQPVLDAIDDLIALSNRHFAAGEQQLQLGHLEMAKGEFNRALDVLLVSPYGARSEPRIRQHFDRLVDRVSAHEVLALAQGDGFTEKKYDAASIDELLAITTFEAPPASAEVAQAVAEDRALHDIEIPLNPRVLSYVQLFTGRLRSYLEEGLGRGARFLPMIQDVFRAEGLPLDLAYIPLIESAFKPNALSRAKAKGIWQFMQGTALENGLKHDWYIDERAEPEKATRAAAKYLKTLHKMFNGDWHLALAAYNGGPGRVQRAMKRSGRDDFWALSASTRYLPRETRDYVPLILAASLVARNPAQYGMNIEPSVPPLFETLVLPAATDIRRIAEWAGVHVQAIQDLNPELRRWTTPVRADYVLKVPAGTASLVDARLDEAQPDELAALNRHTVKKGETLTSIARKLRVSRADLAEANYLSIRARVTPGQQLVIPRAPTLLLAARTETPAPDAESRQLDTVVAASNTAVPAPVTPDRPIVYRVKRGDTLSKIARLFDTTVASLKSWNRLRSNAIKVGQRLTVRSAPGRNATH
ncbi:MAG: LysM peptidoglycan-binding domain-containing protein [Vicinamibacterales bacterium]